MIVRKRQSVYNSLCCGTGSTIPRRKYLRESWVKSYLDLDKPTQATSVNEKSYSGNENLLQEELNNLTGKVTQVRKIFTGKVLSSPTPQRKPSLKPLHQSKPSLEITYKPIRRKYNSVVPHELKNNEIVNSFADYNSNCMSMTGDLTDDSDKSFPNVANQTVCNHSKRQTFPGSRNTRTAVCKKIEKQPLEYDLKGRCKSNTNKRNLYTKETHLFDNDNSTKKYTNDTSSAPELNICSSSSSEQDFSSCLNVQEIGGVKNLTHETFEILKDDYNPSAFSRRFGAGDVGGMCDKIELPSLVIPRIIGASVKSYRDIPEELFDSLPESSVDPNPNDVKISPTNSEWSNMREGRRSFLNTFEDNSYEYKIEEIESLEYQTDCASSTSPDTDFETHGHDDLPPGGKNIRNVWDSIQPVSPHPAPKLLASSEFPLPLQNNLPQFSDHEKTYYKKIERDLQRAGVYFRRPPLEINTCGAEEVKLVLDTLDASLEGFTSDESSSSRSCESMIAPVPQNSTVVTRVSSQYDVFSKKLPSEIRSREATSQSRCDNNMRPVSECYKPFNKTVIEIRSHSDRNSEETKSSHIQCTKESDLENLNLIEEVYVASRTKTVPSSTVEMRAYYPKVHHGKDISSNFALDSDSGHESGATSPCDNITLGDEISSPPSPPISKLPQKAQLNQNCELKSQKLFLGCRDARTNNLSKISTSSVSTKEVIGETIKDNEFCHRLQVNSEKSSSHIVVVAIDFGTTYSGYAFSFTNDPENIHMMKKWEGGDPGIQNQKTPTIVLLTPDEDFDSLGFAARDNYHDLDPKESQKWLYFDKFKMKLHSDQTLTRETMLEATNGKKISALKIFSYALSYFRDHALKELGEQIGFELNDEEVRWVITVPAIWSHPAKQFMRTAAYKAGMGNNLCPDQLLIALEPEAAAIYCRRLKQNQMLQEKPPMELRIDRLSENYTSSLRVKSLREGITENSPPIPDLNRDTYICYYNHENADKWLQEGTIYMVVDCGGGTVDITVHQMTDRKSGHLKELHKATGGPYGSIGVDKEFEKLLDTVFGSQFMQMFKTQRSAAYVELMIAFEARKRNASPFKSTPLNVSLPFAFIDFFKKTKGKEVESVIKKHGNALGIKWSSQGMLRIEQDTMKKMFEGTLENIRESIEAVLSTPEVGQLQYMFLVGGFSESELLQKYIRDSFGGLVSVIIPQGMSLAILQGAVKFGLDPSVVTVRRSRLTYGVGVLNKFEDGVHPDDKKVVTGGSVWCADVLDKFVEVDESVAVGDIVTRSYTPATQFQKSVILHLYATSSHDVKFVTEKDVKKVGTLNLHLGELEADNQSVNSDKINSQTPRREITVHLKFGDTEVKASAVDHVTGRCVKAVIDLVAH